MLIWHLKTITTAYEEDDNGVDKDREDTIEEDISARNKRVLARIQANPYDYGDDEELDEEIEMQRSLVERYTGKVEDDPHIYGTHLIIDVQIDADYILRAKHSRISWRRAGECKWRWFRWATSQEAKNISRRTPK